MGGAFAQVGEVVAADGDVADLAAGADALAVEVHLEAGVAGEEVAVRRVELLVVAADLERVWFELQREMVASGQVARYKASVVQPGGESAQGDVVRVDSRRGSITTRIVITERVPAGTMFMTFHYKESPVNELTNSAADPVTGTAEFKVCAVRLERVRHLQEVLA